MKTWKYRYLGADDKPLVRCPECDGNLTAEAGICLVLASDKGHVWEEEDQLDEAGVLMDLGRQVSIGNHSATCCGEMLINIEGVIEEEIGCSS